MYHPVTLGGNFVSNLKMYILLKEGKTNSSKLNILHNKSKKECTANIGVLKNNTPVQ